MCSPVAFSPREMDIISAIRNIDPTAKFSIKGKLENRHDYLYGGIEWIDSIPVEWNQILDKIDEKRQQERRQY
tara:strand:+ start:957 stop:1175 length:219 start_codon:yes stop_codon:yes gene_type:complete